MNSIRNLAVALAGLLWRCYGLILDLRNKYLRTILGIPLEQPQEEASETDSRQCEYILITHIRATDLECGLRRLPAGFYISVESDGLVANTSNKTVSIGKDIAEWDEDIILPSAPSLIVSFKIYASFEQGSRFGSGELLEQFEPIKFLGSRGELLSSSLTLEIITERRNCHGNECQTGFGLAKPATKSEAEELTDEGHRTLLCYRQGQGQAYLDNAIQCFQRVYDSCSVDHPNRSAASFNLANAKVIHCQANNHYVDLNVPIALYRDALHLRTTGHPDHITTVLELGFALLARFERKGYEADRMEATDMLGKVMELVPGDSHTYQAGWFALEMTKVLVSLQAIDSKTSHDADSSDSIDKTRAMVLASSHSDPRHTTLLDQLGGLLYGRFQKNGSLADIHEAISMLDEAVQLVPDGHADRPGFLTHLGVLLESRFKRLGNMVDVERSILILEEALCHTPDGHLDKPRSLNKLGNALFCRFQRLGDVADIMKSVSMIKEAVYLTPDGHPGKPGLFDDLGYSLLSRFERLGDISDIAESVSMFEEAVRHTPDGDPSKPGRLNDLGNSLSSRFERLGDTADITKSVQVKEEAVHLTPDDHPDKPSRLSSLGDSLLSRFERFGDITDIMKSVSMNKEAVRLTPDGHPVKPSRLSSLGSSLFTRFERLGDIADIMESVSMKEEAVRLTPDDHPDRPGWLDNLGNSLLRRFQHLGDVVDITKSVQMKEEAVRLAPDNHPNKHNWLSNLGSSLSRRFERLGDTADIMKSVSIFEEAVRLTPDDHPDKPTLLNNLGNSLSHRFNCLGDLADLAESVLMKEEAIRLTPDGHPNKPTWLNNLGNSLLGRFGRLGDVADITKSILMLKEAVCLTPDSHPDKPALLDNLGRSLFGRFERLDNAADIMESISMVEEAIRLTPDGHPNKPSRLSNLGNSLLLRFERLGDVSDIIKSVSVNEEAVRLTPDGHAEKPKWLNDLGNSLSCRFERLGDITDITKSVRMKEEAVYLTPDGHPIKATWLNNLGVSLCHRFKFLGDGADITKSVSIFEAAVHRIPDDHPGKPNLLNNLGNSLFLRFECFGDTVDITKSISMHEEAVRLAPDDHPDKPIWLDSLGISLFSRFGCLSDVADITRSISMEEEAIRLTPDGHPEKPGRLSNLGNSLSSRFKRLGDISDMTKSVSMAEEAVRLTPDGHPDRPAWLHNLGLKFRTRFDRIHTSSDLFTATSLFSSAAQSSTGPTSIRFEAARSWISSAEVEGNTQTLFDAYTTTLGLLPQLAWIGLPLTERHRVLIDAAVVTRRAAAAALEDGHSELAVEWLEQGRSIVWTQFLQLRTPVDILRVTHPALADEFEQTSKGLESASYRDRVFSDGMQNKLGPSSQSLEEEVQKHHTLALRRDTLLARIRSLPDFDRFLLPKTINELASFATSGPVIYLNAAAERCDALIVMAEPGGVIHIPLPAVTYWHVERMYQLLLEHDRLTVPTDDLLLLTPSGESGAIGREGGPADVEDVPYDRFQLILGFLWCNVVNLVLDALGFSTPPSQVEKMPRIFWCLTGPFAFLPIHAAGIYGSSSTGPKLSDFAISSYIPTLSALTPSTGKEAPHLPSNISLLIVPQPPTDGQPHLSGVNGEIDTIKALSGKSEFISTEDSDGTVEDVTAKMVCTDWVHFSCHGVQDSVHPLDSGLCLADRRRLKLSDIIRLSRPQRGLAFLSACQTATGDKKLSEESVHLAAGMLLAGYDGVIATMWSIMDHDAPKVARDVYKYLFRDGKVPDTMEAAEALHRAVVRLRDEDKVPFSSWVPFIHVGR